MTLREEQEKVQSAVAHTLSHVREDPRLAQRVLANVKGEEPMKKRISVGILLIAAVMTITMTALAATAWPGASEFLGRIVGGWNVNKEAIVTPSVKSNDSKWLKVTATEAYWAVDGLSVILKIDAADDGHIVCIAFEDGMEDEDGAPTGQILIDGELCSLDQWRGEKETIVTTGCPKGEGWVWYKRTEDGLFMILTDSEPDAEALKAGTDVTIQFLSENFQNGERETADVTISLPAMTMQEGHRAK